MASARNQKFGLPVLQTNAFGMAYGAAFTAASAALSGRAFVWDASFDYLWSMLYLSLFGSVLAFGAYLTLLGRIGAVLVLAGNILVLAKARHFSWIKRTAET